MTQVKATASQRVHPVLIGNDYNPLLQLVLEVEQDKIQVNSFTFSLHGTGDLSDLESLQLFYSEESEPKELDSIRSGRFVGDRHAVLTKLVGKPYGNLLKPAWKLTFENQQQLQKGTHVFWLSCRIRTRANLSNKVDAHCIEIQTSSGTIPTRDSTPGIRKRIGVALRKHYQDGVHTSRIPALTTTPNGTLLCVYDLRRRMSRDLQEDIDIGLSRSTDSGQTWEPVKVIMDMGEYGGLPQALNGCSDPGIVVDQNTGEIFCAAVWMWGKSGKHQWGKDGSESGHEIGKRAQFLMVRSRDDGLTWTQPENMTQQLKHPEWILLAPSPQAGLTLNDGTLIMPGQGRDEKDRHFSTLIISRDHGNTWTVAPSTAIGNTESQAVQLADGSILLNARTDRESGIKFRSVWVTKNLGQTWNPHNTHRNTLIEPHCNGSLLLFNYMNNGYLQKILLFANPHSQTSRKHHTIHMSFDEGETWPYESRILLDEGFGNGYPSMTQIGNSHIGIVYEGSQSQLVFERFSINELLEHRK